MEKNDLIARLQAEMGYSSEEATRVVEAMLESLTESLSQGDKITLPGIGTMTVTEGSSRKSPDTPDPEGAEVGLRRIRFSPGKRLKEALLSLDFITRSLD